MNLCYESLFEAAMVITFAEFYAREHGIVQLVILYTPLSKFFHVVPMTLREWGIVVSSIILALVLAKIVTYIIDKNLPYTEKDY